jgi:hypothetical protein
MTKDELFNNLITEISASIVIRSYDRAGCSHDTRRPTTPGERAKLRAIISGALISASMNLDASHRRGIVDAAESIADQMLPGCNGYDTVFCPLVDAIKRLDDASR